MTRESYWKIVDDLDALVAKNGSRQLTNMDENEMKAWNRRRVPLVEYMDDAERWFVTRVSLHLDRDEGTPIEFIEVAEAIYRKAELERGEGTPL